MDLNILSPETVEVSASGKAILIGEHAVVYGYKALAVGLPDIKLTMTLEGYSKEANLQKKSSNNWSTTIHGKTVKVEERIYKLLNTAFEKALCLMGVFKPLSEFVNQKIKIDSQIPLGGGMGGSAAISTCLVRIAAKVAKRKLTLSDEIQYANEVDSLFHSGRASGLDVSAVASQGIIQFQKGHTPKPVQSKNSFWLALVDSGERSETAVMVQKVKELFEKSSDIANELFKKLDSLVIKSVTLLENGCLVEFGECLNMAHIYLDKIGVSTQKINQIVEDLRNRGAIGAKITGAGGGGLVMGIFQQKPHFLVEKYSPENVFLSYLSSG